jgi:putative colanic acid biosynthesis acetyltransferase WcaF
MTIRQDLSQFRVPGGFRGRSALFVQLWWMVQATLFRLSPQVAYGFRRTLLRIFGAKVGKAVLIRPTAKITYPWKVELGEHVWVGDNVVIYSLGKISIGEHSVVSQGSYLCGGDHDYERRDFLIRAKDISIGKGVWIAAEVFVAPGVTIADGAVIGARSLVIDDMPEDTVCAGAPARAIKPRVLLENNSM